VLDSMASPAIAIRGRDLSLFWQANNPIRPQNKTVKKESCFTIEKFNDCVFCEPVNVKVH
jgi:hypothetical protein